jgi:hypothetical protein
VEGYGRKGKLTQDLLETCNLDEREDGGKKGE